MLTSHGSSGLTSGINEQYCGMRNAAIVGAGLSLCWKIYDGAFGVDGKDPATSRLARDPLDVVWDCADVLRAIESLLTQGNRPIADGLADLESVAMDEMNLSRAVRAILGIRDRLTLTIFDNALDRARSALAEASSWRSILEAS